MNGHSNLMRSVPFDCVIRHAHEASIDCHQHLIPVAALPWQGEDIERIRRHHVGGCGRLSAPRGRPLRPPRRRSRRRPWSRSSSTPSSPPASTPTIRRWGWRQRRDGERIQCVVVFEIRAPRQFGPQHVEIPRESKRVRFRLWRSDDERICRNICAAGR